MGKYVVGFYNQWVWDELFVYQVEADSEEEAICNAILEYDSDYEDWINEKLKGKKLRLLKIACHEMDFILSDPIKLTR